MTNLGCPLVPNAPCELDKITHMWHQITHGGIQSRQSKSHMVAGLQWNVSKKSISHPEAALQYIYIYLDLQTPNIFWPFWLFTNYGWNRLVFWDCHQKLYTYDRAITKVHFATNLPSRLRRPCETSRLVFHDFATSLAKSRCEILNQWTSVDPDSWRLMVRGFLGWFIIGFPTVAAYYALIMVDSGW